MSYHVIFGHIAPLFLVTVSDYFQSQYHIICNQTSFQVRVPHCLNQSTPSFLVRNSIISCQNTVLFPVTIPPHFCSQYHIISNQNTTLFESECHIISGQKPHHVQSEDHVISSHNTTSFLVTVPHHF